MCKKCLRMRLLFGAVGFVLGTAAGAGGMYLYARRRMKEDAASVDELCQEVNKLNQELHTIYGVRDPEEFNKMIQIIQEADEEDEKGKEEYQELVSRYHTPVSAEKPSLAELAAQAGIKAEIELAKEDKEEFGEDYFSEMEEKEDEEPSDPRDEYDGSSEPHQISEEEFLEDSIFDKDQFTYYIDDDTLCDVDDNVLNTDEYLGDFNVFLGAVREAIRNHEVLIYWRMPSISEDVEIELKQTSYSSYVLGIDPNDVGGFRRGGRKQVSEEDDE